METGREEGVPESLLPRVVGVALLHPTFKSDMAASFTSLLAHSRSLPPCRPLSSCQTSDLRLLSYKLICCSLEQTPYHQSSQSLLCPPPCQPQTDSSLLINLSLSQQPDWHQPPATQPVVAGHGCRLGRSILRPILRSEVGLVAHAGAWWDRRKLTGEVLQLYRAPLSVRHWDTALLQVT